jgi:hypothetical protein
MTKSLSFFTMLNVSLFMTAIPAASMLRLVLRG